MCVGMIQVPVSNKPFSVALRRSIEYLWDPPDRTKVYMVAKHHFPMWLLAEHMGWIDISPHKAKQWQFEEQARGHEITINEQTNYWEAAG